MNCFKLRSSLNCVSYIRLLPVCVLPSGLRTPHATPLFVYLYVADIILMRVRLLPYWFSVRGVWSFKFLVHGSRDASEATLALIA